jgi:ribA/ribD-fused uncharacterized protein
MSDVITAFRGEHYFLSNFYPSPVDYEGMAYPTVEHAYQAAKTADVAIRQKVQQAKTPAAAKAMGKKIPQPPDWRSYNLQLMEDLILQKFTRYPDLRELLLATGTAELIEGNTWNDRFFGMTQDKKTGEWHGHNELGKMLMRVREKLRGEDVA